MNVSPQMLAEYVERTDALLSAMFPIVKRAAEERREAERMIPEVVDALISSRRIDETEKSAAATILARGPANILQVLKDVAAHVRPDEARIGTVEPSKSASDAATPPGPLGKKPARDINSTEAGRAFMERVLAARQS